MFVQFFPRSFTAASIREHAPVVSGVYGISNAAEWIYIGESDNIQGALLDHLQNADSPLLKRKPTGFVFEACDRSRRPERQGRLVSEYEPVCNRYGSRIA